MVAIVSLLDAEYSDKVNSLIYELEREFGLKGVQATPYPHITWLTANDGSIDEIKAALGQAAGICCRFMVRTTGLGVFPGVNPVLYIPVLRTYALNRFHHQLHNAISNISQETGAYYHPEFWMPHLSLALGDTTPELVAQAMLYLNRESYCWQMELTNLTLLTKNGDHYLKDGEFPLLDSREPSALKLSSLK
ncbi:2'-5' RNA ligase family protein [Rufibacter roseus]|uniref:2'-5' RNA ligase family protein n=1 Tax=Rufibacter roseus TaxID=1567108 RepID=A0ABW2DSI1_9BACT|nr:2'-5' RNA ligase family protein [Rufibacter roseus]